MDAAAAALNKFISGQPKSDSKTEQDTSSSVKASSAEISSAETASANTTVDTTTVGADDTTVEQEIAPAVEHETVKREYETREQEKVSTAKHQDHYHTTIQPLKAHEAEEKHINETAATEERKINKDTEGDKVKAQVEAERSQFQNTSEEIQEREVKVQEPSVKAGETVHHHLHETIQPVIEKERVVREVTHVEKPVHEVVKEPTVDLGVTTANAISVDEFQGKLSGEHVKEVKHDGEHTVPATTAVTAKDE